MSLGACSANGSNPAGGGGGGSNAGGAAGSGGVLGTGGTGGILDTDSGGTDASNTAVATLEGRVVAPEGTIPISGALVYLSDTPPLPIPDGVFCDECVKLAAGEEYTLSNPDGTFSLGSFSTGKQYLVVQKGQFRRARQIDVVAGTQQVAADVTRLPGRMNKAENDDIPRMAVIVGAWDAIEVSLAKLGLANIVQKPLGATVDPATAGFDMVAGTWPPDLQDPMKNPDKFLKTWDIMSRYHVIFIPCSGSEGTTCTYTTPDNSVVRDNLIRFVKEGGKLYVTDYSYEYVRRPWPAYVSWENESSSTGSACLTGEYTAPASVEDPDMAAWLAAQGIGSFDVEANWTRITGLHKQTGESPTGTPLDITPKAWVMGGSDPATISFEDRCGRVLFSTYHTEGNAGTAEFLPQEKALLYVLLEVGVCVGPPLPPK